MNLFKRTATTKTIFFVVSDVVFIAFSVWLAFSLRFDGAIPQSYYPLVWRLIALATAAIVLVFYFEKLYSFTWSYVSASELVSLWRATTIAFALLAIGIFVFESFFPGLPRSVLVISYGLVFILCGAIRLSKRVYLYQIDFKKISGRDRALIVGAGDAGEQILRSILTAKQTLYFPVGFVDDSTIKQGVKIHGVKVLGRISDIPAVVEKYDIKQMIVALPSASNKVIKNAVDLGRQAGLYKIRIAPPLQEIMRGEISIKNLRSVEAEDLLGRPPIQLNSSQIEQFIRGKVVLITGAAGSIGSELVRQTVKFAPSIVVLLDQDESGLFYIGREMHRDASGQPIREIVADICDRKKMEQVFLAHKPQIVFHAAAYKHVPLMQAQPDEAVKNNILGVQTLVDASIKYGVEKFIFVSTDKAVNPTSVMGATKRAGEMLCQAANGQGGVKCISVRFGNVLNSRGSVIPIFREQIRRGGPVEVTHPDMTRYFMLISEACLLVMQAGAMGGGGEVFVLDMGKSVKILDLARDMIRLSGFEPDKDIPIVFTGIRPGEKLFEEILTSEEGTTATINQKIFMAKLSPPDQVEFAKKIVIVKQLAESGDAQAIIASLKDMVPFLNDEV